ncbi:DDE superfamily endonuclease [Phytophthora infestans]|uniref:DDE superfamily endonuclease n=1 Tax=Phytophthora infestans TaxID=4787 RepID=A0A8S9UGN9_PHYIN|nr:DDE superfamily endonuclease [Phytophthora infestans]
MVFIGPQRDSSLLALLAVAIVDEDGSRQEQFVRSRLLWTLEKERLLREGQFSRCFRMSPGAFDKLCRMVSLELCLNPRTWKYRGAITVTNRLQMLLRYMAGGAVIDIRRIGGVSLPSFYRVLYDTSRAIVALTELSIRFPMSSTERESIARGFKVVSSGGIISGCIGAMDGWLCSIVTPPTRKVDQVAEGEDPGAGVRAYFSGHYGTMGINAQAVCDHYCRFTYINASNPGGSNDVKAYRESRIPWLVEGLERGLYVVTDNAYMATNHLLTPYTRPQIGDIIYRDSFNFHVSQVRIRVEMAFGLLVNKWRLFKSPLSVKLENATLLIHCAAVLHNFVVNARLKTTVNPVGHEISSLGELVGSFSLTDILAYDASDLADAGATTSFVREGIVEKLKTQSQLRPHMPMNKQ